jgi:starch phosphorylase
VARCDERPFAGFADEVRLDSSGAFGYTVRVVPQHAGPTSVADVGLVAND